LSFSTIFSYHLLIIYSFAIKVSHSATTPARIIAAQALKSLLLTYVPVNFFPQIIKAS
jgi:hypothetical protein